ncbi:thioredoxin-related transmembrane protein 1 isoform X2 [Carcharodon carcharias]|uniref:thioredoxin-related transmembrane protein 1 isoform X2 n=1 Tax=Carcharodon carcharias TaxID=13397 RepID=UPI001B7F3724|nr:thioredoxin-related transmembrane protein 1 isoform X2 [Carcharodon carcharias]
MAAAGAPGRLRLRLTLLLAVFMSVPAVQAKKSLVKVITDHNWREILEGEWMVEFYAPWCPACQHLQSEWNEFAEWSDDLGVNVAKVDVTEQPGLSGRFIITALPTIYQMTSMSALFQLSMWIRHCHNYFTEVIGIPVWGSYGIFALITLFSGLALGLILVFVADCVLPSRRYKHQPHCSQKKMSLTKPLKPQDGHFQEEDDETEDDLCSQAKESSSRTFEKAVLKDCGDYLQDSVRKRTMEYTSRADDS